MLINVIKLGEHITIDYSTFISLDTLTPELNSVCLRIQFPERIMYADLTVRGVIRLLNVLEITLIGCNKNKATLGLTAPPEIKIERSAKGERQRQEVENLQET